ncbi:MAG: hypothetical protein ACOYI9_05645, partial [Candidatus Hydrogenedentales bacterium]
HLTRATAYTSMAQFTAHTTFMKPECLSYFPVTQSLAFKCFRFYTVISCKMATGQYGLLRVFD